MIAAWAQRAGKGLVRLLDRNAEADGPPPPPADLSYEGVEAWTREHLDLTHWVYLGPHPGCVMLAGKVEPAARFTVPIRMEMFRAEKAPGLGRFRSRIITVEVDAASRWTRLAKVTSFRRSGLQEPYPEDDTASDWSVLDESEAPFLRHILALCDEANGAAREGPDSWLDADIRSWIARTVEAGQDVYSHWDDEGAIYLRPGTARRLSSNGYAVECRVESFWPRHGVRSWTELLQLHQPTRSKQLIKCSLYPEHNLVGEPIPMTDGRWVQAGTAGFRPEHFDRLWALTERLAGPAS